MKVYQQLARLVDWNPTAGEYLDSKNKQVDELIDKYLPSGSGFDGKIELDEKSTDEKIIIHVEYHHMDINGFYDGWSTFKVIITASMAYNYCMQVKGESVVRKYFYHMGFDDFVISVFRDCLDKEMEG